VAFIALAGDAITYTTQPGSNAPKDLTIADLNKIYTCAATTWNEVGGKSHDTIKAYIPQSGSGIRSSFLSGIGIVSGTPGSCVSDESTKADPGGRLQENEGVNTALNTDKANVIFPYSVAKYLAQVYHSAKCLNHFCNVVTSGKNKGKVCLPTKSQNEFGCNEHGTLVLNEVGGTAPTSPWPLPASTTCTTKCPVVSSTFTALLSISQYAVVPYSSNNGASNGVAKYLLPLFGPKGFLCTSATAKSALAAYGFRVYKAGTATGHSSTLCGDTH
jgi:hypothetical protein